VAAKVRIIFILSIISDEKNNFEARRGAADYIVWSTQMTQDLSSFYGIIMIDAD
jgi:hypothetical protein